MTKFKPQDANIAMLIEQYRTAAAAHGAATELGEYRAANRHHDLLAQIYRELRARGTDAQRELLVLLDDVDAHVSAWAAAHALEFAPERGEPVLRRLAANRGFVALNAEMTLQEWSKGTLRFP
jgi:hypothetical protein